MKIRSIFSTVLSVTVAAPFAAWGNSVAGAEPHPSPGAGTVASTSPSAPQVVPGAEPTTTVPGNASSTPPTPTPSSSEPSASSPATSSSTTSSPPTPTPTEPTSTSPTPAPIPVGPHVATVTGIEALGKPTSTEQRWYRAGGGYAQHFERGLALIAVDASGRPIPTIGGVVLDGFAEYYKAHPNTGWPVSPQMSDAKGLWQRFDSPNHAYRGALMRASASAPIHGVDSRVYDYYVSNPAVRQMVGSATASSSAVKAWTRVGGGTVHPFAGGWVTVANSGAKAVVPASFKPNTRVPGTTKFAWDGMYAHGWPKGLPTTRCGGAAILTEKGTGYAMGDTRWCPSAKYAQPLTAIPKQPMPYALTSAGGGDAGWNVKILQRFLGVRDSKGTAHTRFGPLERLTGTTASALARKRASIGWARTPRLDKGLWNKLGIGTPWDEATEPNQPVLGLAATRQERINTMMSYVRNKTYANGYEYTYGAAGPGRVGFDCSGLMLAGMYHAGVYPRSANILDDIIHPTKLTQALYNDTSLKKVPVTQRQPGDLIFYTSNGSASGIGHVGMYVGRDRTFDTANNGYEGANRDMYWLTRSGSMSIMPYAVRPVAEG